MCYAAEHRLRKTLKWARENNQSPDFLRQIEEELERIIEIQKTDREGNQSIPRLADGDYGYYYVSGFAHPWMMVFRRDENGLMTPELMRWGLIPFWTKDLALANKLHNQTLNARSETMFEKPAFRAAAKSRRCIIIVQSFYEYHHVGAKKIPHNIHRKNNASIALAGLWEEWTNKNTGEKLRTFSIVTTAGNKLLAHIHNNPKLDGPRMPAILPDAIATDWLQPIESEGDRQALLDIIAPSDDHPLVAHPVGRLTGKGALGNVPDARKEVAYEELG